MLIIENNLNFVSYNINIDENKLALVTGGFLIPIFTVSLYQLFKLKKQVVIFIVLSMIVFYTLVDLNLLTLSPTRHLIWLNSFIFILITAFIKKYNFKIKNKLLITLSIIIVLSVFSNYQVFFENRKAKINYTYLSSLQKQFKVDYFLGAPFSDNVNKLYIREFKSFLLKLNNSSLSKNFTICLVGHRPVSLGNFSFNNFISTLKINAKKYNYNRDENFLKNISRFKFKEKLIFSENIFSETEVGRSPFCENGTNGRFLRIINISRI